MSSYDERLKFFFTYCVLITFMGVIFLIDTSYGAEDIRQHGGEDPGMAGGFFFVLSIIIFLPIFVVVTSIMALNQPKEKSKSSPLQFDSKHQEIISINQFILIFLFLLFTIVLTGIVISLFKSIAF